MDRGDDAARLYAGGMSLKQVSGALGIPISTIRSRLHKAGALRSRGDGVRLAAEDGRLGSGMRGKRRTFSAEHKSNISRARRAHSDATAAGVSQKPSGYLEYTRGVNKGRSVHVVVMENRLGRQLLPDECVHHIDGDPANNDINNLALLTRSGHSKLHRLQDSLAGIERERNQNGTWR